MKNLIRFYLVLFFTGNIIFVQGQIPCTNFEWAKEGIGQNSGINNHFFHEQSAKITTDQQGYSYITGSFTGTVKFGTYALSSFGGYDIFIAKINPQGEYVWVTQAGGIHTTTWDWAKGISTDAFGNIYITGNCAASAIFGNYTLNSGAYVAKLNNSGIFQWAENISTASVIANSIATEPNGDIYICGGFAGNNITIGNTNYTAAGSDIFVVKYNSSGNALWTTRLGTSKNDDASKIAINPAGGCYVTGIYGDDLNNSNNPIIIKINTNGSVAWTRIAYTELGYNSTIDTDGEGNCYIAGVFQNSIIFQNIYPGLTAIGTYDLFIAKISPNGNWIWIKRAGGPGSMESISGISVNNDGQIVITGRTNGVPTFGNATMPNQIPSSNPHFISQLDTSGHFLWIKLYGHFQFSDISSDSNNAFYITGSYKFPDKFGIYTLPYDHNHTGSYLFTTKIKEAPVSIQPIANKNITCGDTILLNGGGTYYSSAVWNPFVNTINPVTASVYPKQTTTYTLTLSDECGNTASDSVTVYVTPYSATLFATESEIFCGATTTLNATISSNLSNLTYLWGPLSGFLGQPSSTQQQTIKPKQTTQYWVTVNSNTGCTASDTITINVSPYPVNIQNNSQSIACGSSTQLNANVPPSVSDISYSWTPATSLNNPNIANPIATPSTTTTYTVTATTPNGCSATDDVTITVTNPNPPTVNITSNTGSFQLCNGGLTLSAPGFISYEWSNGSTAPNINITQPGTYSVVAYEASGCAGTASVTVTPLAQITAPQGTVLCPNQAGQTLQLIATGGMDSYQWSNGSQSQSIQVTQAGNYSVTVKKGACTYTTSTQVTISNGQASADFSHTSQNLTVNFSVISPSINFLSWQFGDGNTSFDQNPTHTYASPGTYEVTVTVTDICGNTAERKRNVTVPTSGSVSIEDDKPNRLILYPNPAEAQVFITSQSLIKSIELKDISGKIIYRENVNQTEAILDISYLSSGMYLVEINDGESKHLRKIIRK